jgi:hypothetical protein
VQSQRQPARELSRPFKPFLLSTLLVSDTTTSTFHSFAATFNPLLRFVLHLPVKASNNTQHTRVFRTTINTTGRPGLGAYCASPSFPIHRCAGGSAHHATSTHSHPSSAKKCETSNQSLLQRRQASKLTITLSQPD